ncbi:MAG: hypothetical protein KKE05_03445 [Nanoarchaeota archaeon]|nr:hypothetical protein [Nanoarchaeota archaeon]
MDIVPYGNWRKAPIVRMLSPWDNFTRASPPVWVFFASLLIWMVGLGFNLSWFVWAGGFVVLFFLAVAISIFESL